MEKLAIFVDWENLRIELETIQRHHKEFGERFFNFNNHDHLHAFFRAFMEKDEVLMDDKIFLYVSTPLKEWEGQILDHSMDGYKLERYKQENPEEYKEARRKSDITKIFNQEMRLSGFFEVRQVKLKVEFEERLNEEYVKEINKSVKMPTIKPRLKQKQADTYLAADVVKVSCKDWADKILLFSKDTDMVPPLEYAKQEGRKVFVAHVTESGNFVPNALREVVGKVGIRQKTIKEILSHIPKGATRLPAEKTHPNAPFNPLKNAFKQ
ncbi:NYN domain-containing protein [Helicobacter baculiformis]|uniref:NYN domain-containing protein n=1 Tax=Helicobacter baculiformis TaxID=427351 RepID=A0ABV7ZF23_9HELI|nr:NYN domain-containing protein [Helicobacter baculiformis]